MATAETVYREMLDAWNRRDFDAMRALFHPEYTYVGGDGKTVPGGPRWESRLQRATPRPFPTATPRLRRPSVQGNSAVSEFRVTGTHTGELMGVRPTGRPIDLFICNVCEMKDGLVFQEREYFDAAVMWEQLGVFTIPGAD